MKGYIISNNSINIRLLNLKLDSTKNMDIKNTKTINIYINIKK